jgi:LexA DNA binding domain
MSMRKKASTRRCQDDHDILWPELGFSRPIRGVTATPNAWNQGQRAAVFSFTRLQGQYLAFIATYTKLHGIPPAEADLQAYFRVTPPTIHQMILRLEERGLIQRQPGRPRSIQVLVPRDELPPLD